MSERDLKWEEIIVLETAIDDMNPEFYPFIIEKLLMSGARDAYLQPIIMKKGRPGVLLTALTPDQNLEQILDIIIRETTTLGIRMRTEKRVCLAREFINVETRYGPVRVKTAFINECIPVQYSPEYEDCKKLALEKNVPLQEVYTSALLLAKTKINNLDALR